MARQRLDNSRWGFESNCFVCEQSNPSGLRIPFFHDEESAEVVGAFCLGPGFSGAPSYVHGGLLLAIMDEAMAWATIALAGVMALTRQTSATFLRPVSVERPYLVVASLAGADPGGEGTLALAAEILTQATEILTQASGTPAPPAAPGEVCARASATFVPLAGDPARAALGQVATGTDAGYVRG